MAIQIKKGAGPFRDQRLCLMGLVYSVFAFCQWVISHFGDLYKVFVNTGPNFASFVFLNCIFIFLRWKVPPHTRQGLPCHPLPGEGHAQSLLITSA